MSDQHGELVASYINIFFTNRVKGNWGWSHANSIHILIIQKDLGKKDGRKDFTWFGVQVWLRIVPELALTIYWIETLTKISSYFMFSTTDRISHPPSTTENKSQNLLNINQFWLLNLQWLGILHNSCVYLEKPLLSKFTAMCRDNQATQYCTQSELLSNQGRRRGGRDLKACLYKDLGKSFIIIVCICALAPTR